MNKTKLISPAKINLDLKIKYFDENYEKHKISSKVVLLKIKDLIFVSDHSKLQITYHDQDNKIINLKNDIIKKTITFFDQKYKTRTKLKFFVYKNIPISYGLGGGSSNAASILKFLYKHHQIKSNNFKKDAPLIGSDVLLFIDKYPKIIDGLNKFNYSKAKMNSWKRIFIILPLKKNLTKNIYNHFKNYNSRINSKHNSQNNLTRSSMILNKEFKEIFMYLSSFRRDFLKFGMSGSGSSIFISFKEISKEKQILKNFNKYYPLVRIEKSLYFG